MAAGHTVAVADMGKVREWSRALQDPLQEQRERLISDTSNSKQKQAHPTPEHDEDEVGDEEEDWGEAEEGERDAELVRGRVDDVGEGEVFWPRDRFGDNSSRLGRCLRNAHCGLGVVVVVVVVEEGEEGGNTSTETGQLETRGRDFAVRDPTSARSGR